MPDVNARVAVSPSLYCSACGSRRGNRRTLDRTPIRSDGDFVPACSLVEEVAGRGDRNRKRKSIEMIPTILIAAVLCLVMVLPYLPGRFDASAATLSFVVQVAAYVSLLMVPIGLAWMVSRRRFRLWQRLALLLAVLVAFVITMAAVFSNQFAIGVMLGVGALILLRRAYERSRADLDHVGHKRNPIPFYLVCVPLMLVTFRATVIPRAAAWSRDRTIQHSRTLIAEIESFRQRRGHYPVSLQSLNRDVPSGVVGIERFHYEPSGEAYNLFFVRPHVELDAREVVMFNPRDEHRFTSHELDILQYDGEQLDLRRGDRRRTRLSHPHWISILFD